MSTNFTPLLVRTTPKTKKNRMQALSRPGSLLLYILWLCLVGISSNVPEKGIVWIAAHFATKPACVHLIINGAFADDYFDNQIIR